MKDSGAMKVRICLFDDNVQIIESLSTLFSLADDLEITAAYSDAQKVVERIAESKADVVIMDIEMPGTDGINAVKILRKTNPTIPVIMFTVFEDDDRVFEAICAGANGYLLKNTDPAKMIEAVYEVVTGGAPMTPGIARKVLQMFQKQSIKSDEDYALTTREKEILKFLTKGLSYKMIAAECSISVETVRTHIKNIYSKLHVASMTEAVAKALNEKIV